MRNRWARWLGVVGVTAIVGACAGGDVVQGVAPETESATGGPSLGDDTTTTGLDTTSTTLGDGDSTTGIDPDTGTTGSSCLEQELCGDDLDNDCDGETDEDCECDPGATEPCYSGDAATEGVGACVAGERTCGDDGLWGACEGEVTPTDEVCNGVDDDCDAELDEDFGAETCGMGICEVTVETCVDGMEVVCEPGPADANESCDGLDNTCDGNIDEGCDCLDGDMQTCYSGPMGTQGVGVCAAGQQTCQNGAWGACEGDVTPSGELCDGLDNDCDMTADEGNPEGGAACQTGLPGLCAVGEMQCQMGALQCVQTTFPQTEVCDGLDNDCDTGVDEGNPGGGGQCDTGQPGVCAAGTNQCQNGSLQCVQTTPMSGETCDGLDNDCDGSTDENNPGGGAACNTGLPGICGPGTTACANGNLNCNQNEAPTGEICDGLDNDCDTGVDEGNPGGGGACNTGLPGVCADGTFQCQSGNLNCVQNTASSPEVCGDGLDNDCDGTVDDGCGCAHDLCTSGSALDSGCDPCVMQVCAADPYCCNNGWDSLCVGEVLSVCGIMMCPSHWGTCAHNPCVTGTPLTSGCDSTDEDCVATICGVDPYCCSTNWDSLCVNEVGSECGLTCP